ncbi:MAG TPA: VOC family protein [Candidatus Margulisiibacteriota bacterium]|nr:VOC family protein [Candidatus Margulisiibacteriota bacterium]
MGFHHTAVATRDLQATHKFYSEAMGFELVKVIANPTEGGGWAKHAFYEITRDEYIAFWDLHDDSIADTWSPALSTGMGLPIWVNHIAFRAADRADLDARRRRWTEHGCVVHEVDHGWCRSIYTVDPNGILVEFCTTTRAMTAADKQEAIELLTDPQPKVDSTPPEIVVHRPAEQPALAKAG